MLSDDVFLAIEADDDDRLQEVLLASPGRASVVNDEMEPLHLAAWQDKRRAIHLLLRAGAHIDAKAKLGWTPLHFAVYHGAVDAVDALLARKADPNIRDENGHVALHFTTRSRLRSASTIMGLLLHNGAALDLACAAGMGMTNIVKWMLNESPELLKQHPNAADLLSIAVSSRKVELVNLLLALGANPNESRLEPAPLDAGGAIARNGDSSIVMALLEGGADPTLRISPTQLSPIERAQRDKNEVATEIFTTWMDRQ